MAQVKANLSSLNVTQVVALTRTVVTKMTGNANFTTPSPALTALTTAADALESAYNAALAARATAKQATATQVDKIAILMPLLTQEASYVQTASAGDRTKIESSGFSVRNTPAPVGPLPAPENLATDSNMNPGSLGFTWAGVRGARTYTIERAPDGAVPSNWVPVAQTTKPKALVESLASGTRYWFRVAGVNAAGTGLFTDPISKVTP